MKHTGYVMLGSEFFFVLLRVNMSFLMSFQIFLFWGANGTRQQVHGSGNDNVRDKGNEQRRK